VWEKEQGVNFLSAKKNPMRVHEDILIFYLDEAEVKGRSKKFAELRDYFNSELQRSGISSKKVKELLGNDMGGHYFTNGVQWTLPTRENYSKLQLTGFFHKEWDRLKEKYDEIATDCKIPYFPQMEIGKSYISGKGNSGDVTGNVEKKQTLNKGTRYPRSVIKINRETGLHPTQKPVALFEYLIKTYTNEGDLVLDNCAGSGTTGVACKNLNRNYILIEKEPEYIDIINARLNI
jgi:site-specific DNA-methyltransferase (adenine-specific)